MGVFDFFKPKGDTIKGAVEAVGSVALDLRQAITGDDPKLNKMMVENAVKLEEIASSIVKTEMTGNWLQKSWRPILALVCIFVVFMQYSLIPLLDWIMVWNDKVPPPPGQFNAADLWPVIVGLISYRTVEKTSGVRAALGQK